MDPKCFKLVTMQVARRPNEGRGKQLDAGSTGSVLVALGRPMSSMICILDEMMKMHFRFQNKIKYSTSISQVKLTFVKPTIFR